MNAEWTNDVLIANPEVSDNTEWEDFQKLRAEGDEDEVKLPERRRKTGDGNSRGGRTMAMTGGLRIDAVPRKIISADETDKFEVIEWTNPVLRLEPAVTTQTKVKRVQKFHMMPICSRKEHLERLVEIQVASEWGNDSKAIPIKWMIFASSGIFVLLVVGMLLLPWVNAPPAKSRRQISLMAVNEETSEEVTEQNEMITRCAEAEQLFLHFAAAATVDDMLPLVRDSAILADTIRESPVFPKISKTWRPSDSLTWNVYSEGGRTCGVMTGLMPDFTPFSASMVLLDGRLLLDWKGTMGYGTADFSELEQGRGNASEIRGSLKGSYFYTSVFPEETYRSYVFLAPDQTRSIWVYSRRDGRAEALLARSFTGGGIIEPEQNIQRFTLKLSRQDVGGCAPNQWVIKEILHKDWISP